MIIWFINISKIISMQGKLSCLNVSTQIGVYINRSLKTIAPIKTVYDRNLKTQGHLCKKTITCLFMWVGEDYRISITTAIQIILKRGDKNWFWNDLTLFVDCFIIYSLPQNNFCTRYSKTWRPTNNFFLIVILFQWWCGD